MKTKRGRPREFDDLETLRRAQALFLEAGFEAAPYERLAEDLGLSKPSLYNAFGDKTALFVRALEDYAQRAGEQIVASFSDATSLSEAGKKLLLAAAEVYSRPHGPSVGCLLVGTAMPACAEVGAVRETLAQFIARIETTLEHIISTRYAADARRAAKTPRALALLLSSLLFSLAIRARTGLSRRKLRSVAMELAELIA
jgi:AcrR family transcriptional regulator